MKFLALDDEDLSLQNLIDAVKIAAPGCGLAGFTSPREALAYAQTHVLDAAFLDIELGSANGLVLAKELKERQPKLRIIFVTSYDQYAVDAFAVRATGYLLKPVTSDDIRRELTFIYGAQLPAPRVRVQAFGGFDVFVGEKPLAFGRAKSKELLALLVDRCGNAVTTREACAILWEDTPYSRAQKNYFQTVLSDLRATLHGAGIEDILVKSRNALSIDPAKLSCDSYRFLEGDPRAINSYRGDYMRSYSWAEFSVGKFNEYKTK